MSAAICEQSTSLPKRLSRVEASEQSLTLTLESPMRSSEQLPDGALSVDEERQLRARLQQFLASEKPIAKRASCPESKDLRAMAFGQSGRRWRENKLDDHLAHCPACYEEVLGYREDYSERRHKSRQRILLTLGMTFLVASVALLTDWYLGLKPPEAAPAMPVQPVALPSPVAAVEKQPPKEERETPSLRMTSIQLPPWRKDGTRGERAKVTLPRGRLMLWLRLPEESAEGKYILRIVDSNLRPLVTAIGTAIMANDMPQLRFAVDTSLLSANDYRLSVLRPGLGGWTDYQLEIEE